MSDRALNATAASLLGFLHQGPMSGWDLAATAQTLIGDFWSLTRSQVYRELSAMASAGGAGCQVHLGGDLGHARAGAGGAEDVELARREGAVVLVRAAAARTLAALASSSTSDTRR